MPCNEMAAASGEIPAQMTKTGVKPYRKPLVDRNCRWALDQAHHGVGQHEFGSTRNAIDDFSGRLRRETRDADVLIRVSSRDAKTIGM